ncbi:hypothetical protein LJR257_005461 [Ensifer adhaerens]
MTERLTTLLNDAGVSVSKRQVVRLLTKGLDGFVAEDAAVPATPRQVRQVETVRDLVWRFYRTCVDAPSNASKIFSQS